MSILFITATHIGDAILSTGLLAKLMEMYPDDKVTIACGAPAAKIFESTPRLESLHVIRKQKYHRHWFDLWRAMAFRRWRIVVDLRRSALPWMLPAQRRYSIPKSQERIHRVELIAQTLGLPPQDPVVWTGSVHASRADDVLQGERNLLALAPGASWRGKIWSAQNFGELARRLTAPTGPLAGASIVLVGADNERDTGAEISEMLPRDKVVDAFGLDVLTTHEVFRRCRLMVGNDSAMMHLSAAAGIPTVGLFGPTKDYHYGPWGPNGLVVRTPQSVAELVEWPGYDTKTTGSMMNGLEVATVEQNIAEKWGNAL